MVNVSSLSGIWRGAPAANNFAAFWTEMEASGAMISSNVCSFMVGFSMIKFILDKAIDSIRLHHLIQIILSLAAKNPF